MKLLAIETSSAACSVALLIDDELKSIHEISPKQQAQNILPMIEKILLSKNISLNQLDALAFGCGPGSFTGVRIAASVIQGLAFATQIPVISISSLAALAQAAYQELGWRRLLAAVDARIQEVYWGAYEVNDNGLVVLAGEERVSHPEEISQQNGQDWSGVGNAWEIYLKQIPYHPLQIDAARLPTAEAVALLAKPKYVAGDFIDISQALPVYLRNDVAKKHKLCPPKR